MIKDDPLQDLNMDGLVELVETLRGESGCPWDRKQTPVSIASYLLEETYELVDAVGRGSPDDICGELGDVLFLLVFIAGIFREQGKFDIGDVVRRNTRKMVRRHPHVFGESKVADAEEVTSQWQKIKLDENRGKENSSVLGGVPAALPALLRAYRIIERVEKSGFGWSGIADGIGEAEKIWDRFKTALNANEKHSLEKLLGNFLFVLVSVVRTLPLDPERLLHDAVKRFENSFKLMERSIEKSGTTLTDMPSDEKQKFWRQTAVSPFSPHSVSE